ncbi:hypothetical protein PCIT_a1431 [Pseudoalteromonas citrea]|uniref:Uncharacterized protein n=1 Tax=Pseudoalteromonas citrea TaxID=43655 RepID=A0AAD4FTW6_9GAMM|nr:hypothetical protein PCIT_a1431 [Pseudoalteromonas citrea]
MDKGSEADGQTNSFLDINELETKGCFVPRLSFETPCSPEN